MVDVFDKIFILEFEMFENVCLNIIFIRDIFFFGFEGWVFFYEGFVFGDNGFDL